MLNTTDIFENETSAIPKDCNEDQKLMFETYVQVIFTILYSIIGVFGVISNLLMIIVIARSNEMWTSTNVFICNMAVSDLLICLSSVPITPWAAFTGKWYFGWLACKLLPACQGASVYMSSLSLAAIAIDRYKAINGNSGPQTQESLVKAILAVSIINIFSVLSMAPYSFHMEWENLSTGENCVEMWEGNVRTVYGMSIVFTQLVVPTIVSGVAYRKILVKLRQHATTLNSLRTNLKKQQEERARNQRRTKILISILVLFVLCWLPLDFINLAEDLGLRVSCWGYYYFLFFCFHLLACSSACINPLLYGWTNSKIRKEIRLLFTFNSEVPTRSVLAHENKEECVINYRN